jgi:hypothetical protein
MIESFKSRVSFGVAFSPSGSLPRHGSHVSFRFDRRPAAWWSISVRQVGARGTGDQRSRKEFES